MTNISFLLLTTSSAVISLSSLWLYYNTSKKLKESLKKNQELQNELNNQEKDIVKFQVMLNEKEKENTKTEQMLSQIKEKFEKLKEENNEIQKEKEYLKAKLEESKFYEEQIKSFQEKSKEELKMSFENLSNKILEETKNKMINSSKENLSTILQPLQHDIKDFKDKFENMRKANDENMGIFQNEFKNLRELNMVLKGNKKQQGIWGEMVLERTLEISGLVKGREYETEVSLKNNEGKTYRPDVIVYLPNKRDIIIDAKTSLVDYSKYIETDNEEFIKNHIRAIKNHIDRLAEKKYEDLEEINTLDFILMFIPIDNALTSALEKDNTLFEYANKKKVILVSPSTLLISLKVIENNWRFEKQTKNIEEIIKLIEKLYDKLRGFTEDFVKLGKNVKNAYESFGEVEKKLATGNGNAIRQIEIIRQKANIKPKKLINNLTEDGEWKLINEKTIY